MEKKEIIQLEIIENKILIIRGQKVILGSELAKLYNVEVRVLIQAVKRNIDRFPTDFMFQLTLQEYANLKSQTVISSSKTEPNSWGGARRALPYAFTEQGVAMLSSILRSKRAVQVNIAIMRVFVKLREFLSTHKELAQKLKELEFKIDTHDKQIKRIFDVINRLLIIPEKPKRKIGFTID